MKDFTGRKILIIVENLPVPFDRRVWQEATALAEQGALVSVICPKGKGYERAYEEIDGIAIYRHGLPREADGALGYALEYGAALLQEFRLAVKCLRQHGFHVIQACNPPDLIFLVALPFKLLGKHFIFDHHDINPELYLAKFGRKDFLYRLMLLLERLTFNTAEYAIATNQSYYNIAVGRGGKAPERVAIVRSGPSLERMRIVPARGTYRNNRAFAVGYIGVMGRQEGLRYLVEAAHIMVHRWNRRDVQFICVGGGTELDGTIRLAREHGVSDWFTFTGRIPDEDMLEALNSVDLCVNPDEYNEMNDKSTMNKIMEYMALGKPIVQFDLTEGRLTAQDASVYARRNDSEDLARQIVALLEAPERRMRMGAFGRRRVEEELAWPHEKRKYLDVYRTCFGMKTGQERPAGKPAGGAGRPAAASPAGEPVLEAVSDEAGSGDGTEEEISW